MLCLVLSRQTYLFTLIVLSIMEVDMSRKSETLFLCAWPRILKSNFDVILNWTFGQMTYNYKHFSIKLCQCLYLKFRDYRFFFFLPVSFIVYQFNAHWLLEVAVPFPWYHYKKAYFLTKWRFNGESLPTVYEIWTLELLSNHLPIEYLVQNGLWSAMALYLLDSQFCALFTNVEAVRHWSYKS